MSTLKERTAALEVEVEDVKDDIRIIRTDLDNHVTTLEGKFDAIDKRMGSLELKQDRTNLYIKWSLVPLATIAVTLIAEFIRMLLHF